MTSDKNKYMKRKVHLLKKQFQGFLFIRRKSVKIKNKKKKIAMMKIKEKITVISIYKLALGKNVNVSVNKRWQ